MDHPSVIGVGYQPVFHIATAQVACKFVKLIRRTNQVKGISEENPQFLEKGDLAEVELEPMKPVVVEANIPRLGQFAIRDMNRTIGAGKVLKVEPRE